MCTATISTSASAVQTNWKGEKTSRLVVAQRDVGEHISRRFTVTLPGNSARQPHWRVLVVALFFTFFSSSTYCVVLRSSPLPCQTQTAALLVKQLMDKSVEQLENSLVFCSAWWLFFSPREMKRRTVVTVTKRTSITCRPSMILSRPEGSAGAVRQKSDIVII